MPWQVPSAGGRGGPEGRGEREGDMLVVVLWDAGLSVAKGTYDDTLDGALLGGDDVDAEALCRALYGEAPVSLRLLC